MSNETRKSEEEWFLKNERQLLEAAQQAREAREKERAARETEEQRQRLRELHWMKCPKCGHDMAIEDLSGIEIDRCTFCEGIYMDAGELEELFQRKVEERRGILKRMLGI